MFSNLKFFKIPNKKTCLVLLGVFLVIPICFAVFKIFGIVFTYSGSVPIGFYRKLSREIIHHGEYIAFCLPTGIATMGLSRRYIRSGICPSGSEVLIKKVIAVPGDQVIIDNHDIRVTSHHITWHYPAPTHIFDKNHLLVHRFIQDGTYITKGYWVYGDGNIYYAWDSRYYGAIPKRNIRGRLKPLLQF
ncbi:MAG: conjugative transfer signal peptidase TraF [Gammaproteobacteria bacterium]|nr:conjugative transfer signal peptidase TraF [Gammaproteobacteria bacterium]